MCNVHEDGDCMMYDDNTIMCCANCMCWQCRGDYEGGLSLGECVRFPPSIPCLDNCKDDKIPTPEMVLFDSPLLAGPHTFAENYCFEFIPRDDLRETLD